MSAFAPSGLVVMRTPLLPVEEYEAWSAGLRAPHAPDDALDDALAHDRALLRARLAALLERPEIAEAIFLASPDLAESLEQWRRDPESKKGRRAEQGLVRYALRMASRPTPFGLFSGCTAGGVGERTRLEVAERGAYRRHSRLDMDYLFALCEHLARDRALRGELRYRPNSTLYETAGRLRFAEWRVRGRLRTYHLVAFDAFDALRDTLRRAKDGATLHELALTLVASDPDGEITQEDAGAFLHDLVDNQLLVPELELPVTGDESTGSLVRQLAELRGAGEVRARLAHAEETLARIDDAGAGTHPDRYRELAAELETLGVSVDMSRLFQVDLVKPARELAIGPEVVDEIRNGILVLHRFSRPRFARMLDDFRSAFIDRYGAQREMPLLEVLDEESGIGFERAANAAAEASPLLAGLPLQRRADWARASPATTAEAALLQLLLRSAEQGSLEVELTDDDLQRLENPDRPPLPDALQAMVAVAAPSAEAIARGEFRVLLHGGLGPSGARMLGRFCHVDAAIRDGVQKHIEDEEALRPDAAFAEIVHLPAGRIGNILARPVLREYEIPFLGRSGAPRERQLPLDDLTVTVDGDFVRLRSRKLDREVIPRLTTAHNTMNESLGVYRFLAALQRGASMQWDWGSLDAAPFLPRIVRGRVVLSRARWRLAGSDVRPLAAATGAERERLVRRLRAERRIPRFVVLTDGDQELLVDFENVLALDAMLDLVRKREEVLLTELYPRPDELCAEGPEGRFFHELIVPFARRAEATQPAAETAKAPALWIARTFPPGSEWLYAKLYTGTATADRVLCDEIAPLAAEAVARGDARRWFFIRYADPAWHLRVRFQGDPRALHERVKPAIEELARRLVSGGAVWKVQFDTYEREVERYGGPEAIEIVEEMFHRDSQAVVALLASCSGDASADWRWQLMLAGMDRLYADFGFDVASRLRLAQRSRDAFGRQHDYGSRLRDPLADRFRRERRTLERLLDGDPFVPALAERSETIAPLVRDLAARRLHTPLEAIVPSVIHMFVNRLTRSAGPEHELVLYDFLVQLYRSRMARRGEVVALRARR